MENYSVPPNLVPEELPVALILEAKLQFPPGACDFISRWNQVKDLFVLFYPWKVKYLNKRQNHYQIDYTLDAQPHHVHLWEQNPPDDILAHRTNGDIPSNIFFRVDFV